MTDPAATITAAARIADLRDNWDDEGTPGYQLATYERLRATLTACFDQVDSSEQLKLSIVPGPASQIDVYFDAPGGNLTIYFPPLAGQPEFHFRGGDGSVAQGLLPAEPGADPVLVTLLGKLIGHLAKDCG